MLEQTLKSSIPFDPYCYPQQDQEVCSYMTPGQEQLALSLAQGFIIESLHGTGPEQLVQ